MYVAGFERGFFPIGLWSTRIGLSLGPFSDSQLVGLPFCNDSTRTLVTKVLLPEPDTPAIAVNRPIGILTDIPSRLCFLAPSGFHEVWLLLVLAVSVSEAEELECGLEGYFCVEDVGEFHVVRVSR